jgi:hypothetical protein
MCFDPVTMAIIGATALAGGATAKYAGAQQAQKAQMNVFNAEQQRQKGFQDQQDALFQAALDRNRGLAGADTDAAEANRKAAFISALNGRMPNQDFLPGSSSADAAVAESGNKIVGAQRTESENLASAKARLEGLGDAMFANNIATGRTAQQMGQVSSFRRGSAAALDPELVAAMNKGANLRGFGDLAMAIGTSALGGSLGAGLGFGGTAAGATGSTVGSSAAISDAIAKAIARKALTGGVT